MSAAPPTVLVTALDWGLGHAARVVPVVQVLQQLGARVLLGSAGAASALLQRECPGLPHYEFPAYGVRYPSRNMYWNLAIQTPHLLSTISREQRYTAALVAQEGVAGIISDSRFGCVARGIPSVLITHQLEPRMQALAALVVQPLYRAVLNRFDEVWIPDWPPPHNLSGALSRARHLAQQPQYLGLLSRLVSKPSSGSTSPPYDYIALLSGPEPQRTYWEQDILQQLGRLAGHHLVIRGVREAPLPPDWPANVDCHHLLAASELEYWLPQGRWVVCRAGYSSLMDLATLRQRAIVVPTPGQTEQYYLAQRCARYGWAIYQPQDGLNLAALATATFTPDWPDPTETSSLLIQQVSGWLARISQSSKTETDGGL